MTMLRFVARLTAVVAMAAAALPAGAQDVLWLPTGADDYNTPANWSTEFVPDAGFNEQSVINNGGTAILTAMPAAPTGGVTLGQAAADSGTLEIGAGGNLTAIVGTAPAGTPPNGSVVVGAAGTGTLRVLPGGTLNATALISGGNATSSITLGGAGEGTANVNISGGISLSRTTRVSHNAAVTAGTLFLQPESNYIAEIDSTGNAIPEIVGTAQLGGTLSVEFSGVTPTVGSTFNLFEAGVIAGAFDSVNVSPNLPLSLGQKWVVSGVSTGGGRQFGQLKLDEFLVLNVNRGTGAVSISNPGTQAQSMDSYSILSASGSLLPASWNSLDDQNVLGGNWGEANPNANRLSELKAAGSSSFASGASQTLGIANSFNPTEFGTDTNDIDFEYTRADGTLINGIVNYIGDPNNLQLMVDPITGEAELKNTSPFTVAIDSYTIRSASGSLAPSGWLSLDDQNTAGGDWGEANVSENRLTELKPGGATTLSPGTAFGLGDLFETTGSQDLQFEFLFDGETVARTGLVAYGAIAPELTGDYNGNGAVDAADYTVWRDSLGQSGSGLAADGNGDDMITQADYTVWKNNFGMTSGSGSALNAAAAVPEPATWLLSITAVSLLRLRRSRLTRP